MSENKRYLLIRSIHTHSHSNRKPKADLMILRLRRASRIITAQYFLIFRGNNPVCVARENLNKKINYSSVACIFLPRMRQKLVDTRSVRYQPQAGGVVRRRRQSAKVREGWEFVLALVLPQRSRSRFDFLGFPSKNAVRKGGERIRANYTYIVPFLRAV